MTWLKATLSSLVFITILGLIGAPLTIADAPAPNGTCKRVHRAGDDFICGGPGQGCVVDLEEVPSDPTQPAVGVGTCQNIGNDCHCVATNLLVILRVIDIAHDAALASQQFANLPTTLACQQHRILFTDIVKAAQDLQVAAPLKFWDARIKNKLDTVIVIFPDMVDNEESCNRSIPPTQEGEIIQGLGNRVLEMVNYEDNRVQ